MRALHRILSLFVVLVTLYLGFSGALIQVIDLKTLYSHAPATDPDMIAIREDKDGPDEYQVLDTPDYAAVPIPETIDYQTAFRKLVEAARTQLGNAPIDYAEVRMGQAGVVGVIEAGRQLVQYDFSSGQSQVVPETHHERIPASTRNTVKHLHRMTTFGDWALWINPIVGIALGVFVATGVVMYWRLLAARRRIKRPQWFWVAGGWWRTAHRWFSIAASFFILVIAVSGTWLAVESLIFGFYLSSHRPLPGQPMVQISGVTPLAESQIPAMLAAALRGYRASLAEQPLKVLRLRVFGGMSQGILVCGIGDNTQQVVLNTTNGQRARLTEPGYPPTGFPFGWQAHQIAKQVHRGSYFGMSGRWMDLIGGLALIYLSISGVVMYVEMWNRRRKSGRNGLIWT